MGRASRQKAERRARGVVRQLRPRPGSWSGDYRVKTVDAAPAHVASRPDWHRTSGPYRINLLLRERDRIELIVETVRAERSAGASWAAVGRSLGVSRQAAWQRYWWVDNVEATPP
jgi:hypothetical protein